MSKAIPDNPPENGAKGSGEYARDESPVTDRLIAKIMASHANGLPEKTLGFASQFMADTLMVGIAGRCNKTSDAVYSAAQKWDGGAAGNCAVLGRGGEKMSAHSAAMVNGFQIHCLEWDALHEPSVVIAICTPMAAIISESQCQNTTVGEALSALVLGVETAVFFGAAATGQPRFFRPSAAGLMGASIAIGLLRGFDARQMTDLIGLAYSQVSGTMQAHWEGSEALPLQIGIAARSALTAADMVDVGISGPHDIVAGKFGYFNLIEPSSDLEPHFQQWGAPWKIEEVAHKPFPAGRATQATLTAIRDIQSETPFTMDDVESLSVHMPSLVKLLVGRAYKPDMSGAYARLCLEYIAPMMIRSGKIDPTRFSSADFANPIAQEDAKKINIILDDNPDPNALSPQTIVLKLNDGREISKIIDVTFGSPGRPMTRADELVKAHLCLESAGHSGDPAQIFALFDAADAKMTMQDIMTAISVEEGSLA